MLKQKEVELSFSNGDLKFVVLYLRFLSSQKAGGDDLSS